MKSIKSTIETFSKLLNEIAGFGIVASSALIVLNIILREIFKKPILGTYEFVGFLSSVIVGGGIAYCAILNGHIAVDFIIEKFSKKVQSIIEKIVYIVLFALTGLLAWKMFLYAMQFVKNGEVSPTTQTPFYIFPCFIGVCFLILSFVFIDKLNKLPETKDKDEVKFNEF